jgi:uncharacterized protein YndB with AHSA1/START domain
MTPDRIERRVLLHASLRRVWGAVADAKQFGQWFGVAFDDAFAAGQHLTGRIVPTRVDPEVGRMQEPHRGKAFSFEVDRVEPMTMISFRWHPYTIDPDIDYTQEHMTVIRFELAERSDGILLTISESGFAGIPSYRRAEAFAANDGGWAKQLELVSRYLEMTLPSVH